MHVACISCSLFFFFFFFFFFFCSGGHLGRDKTQKKVADRFYWKSLWSDVEQYIKTCDVCQRTNDAKFSKQAASLHPISIKPEVWQQVNIIIIIIQ